MISATQLVNGIWMGTVLIALGLLPGLLEHFSDLLQKLKGGFVPVAIQSRWRIQNRRMEVRRQPWLAVLGGVLIAASIVLYIVQ
jgi:hypothetical protein